MLSGQTRSLQVAVQLTGQYTESVKMVLKDRTPYNPAPLKTSF